MSEDVKGCPYGRTHCKGLGMCRFSDGWRFSTAYPQCITDDDLMITEHEQQMIDRGGETALIHYVNRWWPRRLKMEFNLRLRSFEVNDWMTRRERFWAIYLMLRYEANKRIKGRAKKAEFKREFVTEITRRRARGDLAKDVDRYMYDNFNRGPNGEWNVTWSLVRRWRKKIDRNLEDYKTKYLKGGEPKVDAGNVICIQFEKEDA